MPSCYWYTCDRCQDRSFRYRNVVRCKKCGGNLIRENTTPLSVRVLEILHRLVEAEPILECMHCGAQRYLGDKILRHNPDCPWQQARKLLGVL